MSIVRQVLVSLLVIVFAALGWFAFSHRDLVLSDLGVTGVATADLASPAGQPGSGGGSGGGGNRSGSAAGGGRSGSSAGGAGFGRGLSTPPVIAAGVDIQATGDRLTAIGTLSAVQEVTLFPQVSGIVTAIDFKPGSHVDASQTLLKL